MKSTAKQVLDQIYPPTASPYTDDELSEMAAPLSSKEIEQERRDRIDRRTKNQRSRQWWNNR